MPLYAYFIEHISSDQYFSGTNIKRANLKDNGKSGGVFLVDFELHYQAKKSLRYHLTQANQYFDQEFALPTMSFQLRGKAAGKAYLHDWQIRLNPILFKENKTAFLEEVIPHELAHLLTYKLFGRVKPHGKEWQMVMERVFALPGKATHRFEVTSVQGRTFEYQCDCQCYPLTIRRHNKVKNGTTQYSCRKCKKVLVYTGVQLS